jgi:group I intron endonuclease
MTQVIYKIINLVNDKFYVGSTTNKKVRFREHRKQLRGNRHHCKHLQAAWNRYGEAKFVFVVIEEVPDACDLAAVEDRYLRDHFGQPYCYNSGAAAVAPWRGVYGAAHFNFGRTMAEPQKEKISNTLKAFYAEDYANHPRVGTTHSEETRAKISASKLANPARPWQGKERSVDTRAKIGDAQRGKAKTPGRTVSEAGRAKIKANIEAGRSHMHWVGRTHTEESRAKMSRAVEATAPDGAATRYVSITELRTAMGITAPTVDRALKSGRALTKGKFAGWGFKYVDPAQTA